MRRRRFPSVHPLGLRGHLVIENRGRWLDRFLNDRLLDFRYRDSLHVAVIVEVGKRSVEEIDIHSLPDFLQPVHRLVDRATAWQLVALVHGDHHEPVFEYLPGCCEGFAVCLPGVERSFQRFGDNPRFLGRKLPVGLINPHPGLKIDITKRNVHD